MMFLGIVNMLLLLLGFFHGLRKNDGAIHQAPAPNLAAQTADSEKG